MRTTGPRLSVEKTRVRMVEYERIKDQTDFLCWFPRIRGQGVHEAILVPAFVVQIERNQRC